MIDTELENIFKPEDFNGYTSSEQIARRARELLKKYAEKNWPIFYGQINDGSDVSVLTQEKFDCDMHSVRLAFVTEIKKECKHEPAFGNSGGGFTVRCKICDKQLKLPDTWQEA